MSDPAMFDTLAYAKKLKSAGFTDEQAEVQAEALAGIIDEKLATSSAFSVKDGSVNTLLRVQGDGNVGIGTTAPTEKLDVAGNINASEAVTQGSSREIKGNITRISPEQTMKAFRQLEPVSFVYKMTVPWKTSWIYCRRRA